MMVWWEFFVIRFWNI